MRLSKQSKNLSKNASASLNGFDKSGNFDVLLKSGHTLPLTIAGRHKTVNTKQLEAGAAIHWALEELEPINMALNDAVTVGLEERCDVRISLGSR